MSPEDIEHLKAFACAICTRPISDAEKRAVVDASLAHGGTSPNLMLARLRMEEAQAMLIAFNQAVALWPANHPPANA